MSDQPSEEEVRHWTRRFASQSNNRAWDLVEQDERTDEETDEMLHAAHASARLWRAVGTELNAARADLLLGIVHGLAGNGRLAQRYAEAAHLYFSANDCPDWEAALLQTALAAAARAAGDGAAHRLHYVEAQRRADAIANPEDREIVLRTLTRIPAP